MAIWDTRGDEGRSVGPLRNKVRDARHSVKAVCRAMLARLKTAFAPVLRFSAPAFQWVRPAGAAIAQGPIGRAVSKSIRRRIVIGNMLALSVLLIGWTALSQQNTWLIDAKRDALETQGRIMAAAIAQSSEPTGGRQAIFRFDPDLMGRDTARLSDLKSGSDLDFKIRPEDAAPVVARLIEGTATRVRIFVPDGTPIVDSARFIQSDGRMADGSNETNSPLTKPKNFWTRLLKFRLQSDLPVYQDIEGINGRSFPEVTRSLKQGKVFSMLLMADDGDQIVAVSAPVIRAGKVNGVLMLSTKPGDIDALLFSERLRLLLFTAIALIAMYVASKWLGRTVGEPIEQLSAAAEDVSADINASDRLPSFGHRTDEIGQLSRSFEKMTTTLRNRLETSERFAADVAHELKNPLTAARAMAETLPLARTEEKRDEIIAEISKELGRLDRLISDVSNAQRLDAELLLQEAQSISLVKITNEIVQIFDDIFDTPKHGNVSVAFHSKIPDGGGIVRGHDISLGQVITNLIDNAGSFSPSDGTIDVCLTEVGNVLRLTVEDEGPGIDPEQSDKIFKRFYTWRPTQHSSRGSNSGLGLSIAQEIVHAHNGRITVENRTDRSGARFTIELPVAVQSPAHRSSPRSDAMRSKLRVGRRVKRDESPKRDDEVRI